MACEENPCENDAVCLFEDERPVCYCVPDYHGTLCELKYDDCESKFANCENGGTCIDGIDSFTCACPIFYSGRFCNVYDLPSSTFATFGGPFQTDSDQRITAPDSFTTESSTLPETEASSFTTTSTPFKSTSRSYTKWYPFAEVTSSTLDRSDTDSFSSVSTSYGESGVTETSQFVTGISSLSSLLVSKEIAEIETVSPGPRTLSSVSSDVSSVTPTAKIEAEYLTQRTIYNEAARTETSYHEDAGEVFTSVEDTSLSEAGTTMGYVSSTG